MSPELAKRLAESTKNFYEDQGQAFSQTRSFVWSLERFIVERLQPSMTIVDVGAGNGRFARLLPEKITYLGIEPSAALRAQAPTELDIRPGSLPHLPLADQTADVTLCLAVLHHIPTFEARRAAIKELIRITRVGGWIFASSWCSPENVEPIPEADPGDIWVSWKTGQTAHKRYVHLMQPDEWEQLWCFPELKLEHHGLFGNQTWTDDVQDARNWLVIAQRLP